MFFIFFLQSSQLIQILPLLILSNDLFYFKIRKTLNNPLFYLRIILIHYVTIIVERLVKDLNFAINSFLAEQRFFIRVHLNVFLVLGLIG